MADLQNTETKPTTTVRDLYDGLGNTPNLYSWHGEDTDVPEAENVTNVDAVPTAYESYNGAHFLVQRNRTRFHPFDVADYSGEKARWMALPGTLVTSESILRGQSNRAALVREYGDYARFLEITGNDWSEYVVPVDTELPDSLARALVMLADEYPVLDDEDHSAREEEARTADWKSFGLADAEREVSRALDTIAEFADDDYDEHVTAERVDEWITEHAPEVISEYTPEVLGGSHFDTERHAVAIAEWIADTDKLARQTTANGGNE